MKRLHLLGLATVLALPLSSHAAYNPGSAACSGNFSVNLEGQVALRCEGNLSLTGGEITSDNRISIDATGGLLLDAILLTSPQISITAGDQLSISGSVVFKDPETPFTAPPELDLRAQGGSVVLRPDLTPVNNGSISGNITVTVPTPVTVINVTPAVPEPGTWALAGAGLLAVALMRRRGTRTA